MTNLRETSKLSFSLYGDSPTHQEIQTGALQRIADATERMAQRHTDLIRERDYWERRAKDAERSLQAAARRHTALRGHITRLKRATAGTTDNHLPAPAGEKGQQ